MQQGQEPQVFSMASWKQCQFNERLLDLFMEKLGIDHGAGHPLLLLCHTKAPNYRKNKEFKDSANYSQWPKVAGAMIEARS